jgi:hypothetical protein
MKFFYSVLPAILLVAFLSCKHEAATTTEETSTDTLTSGRANTANARNPNLAANMNWTFLTDKLFHHRVTVASGKVDENARKGHWIDFHDNGKYDYGVWGDKTLDGTWFYDDNAKLLQLTPSGQEKPSEWRLMHKDDNLIMVGTATHGDNAQQVQWIRHEERPDKNAKPAEDEDQ